MSLGWSGAMGAVLLGQSCRPPDPAYLPRPALRLAGTYSVEEPGLFSVLSPEFSARTQRKLAATFVGSGEALELAKQGQADVVWSHARPEEDAFVSDGYGINLRDVMYSEFVIVGPSADPAKIAGASSAVDALARLSRVRAAFVSRGDQSGTQARELALWKLAGVEPDPSWYSSLHAGTLATLREASQRGAYALSDLPTFLTQEQQLALKVLVRGDSRLHSPFAVVAVNPDRFPDSDYEGAMTFIDFLTSEVGQELIANYGRARFGTPLFHPLAERGGID
jgi:tungstate transport system substrate-binding protein